MSHKLHRLTSSLYNTPLLIEQNAFKGILGYLGERNLGEVKMDSGEDDPFEMPERYIYNQDTQTGVIELIGPITAKPITMMGFDCGGANYLHLKQDFESLIEMGAKTIAMIVDSPGGTAYSMSDSANYIRKILDENGVELITFIDGMSASAGYGLTCISDKIIGSWDAECGSIGVLVNLWNDSKALEMEGYERTFVTAGSEKVPYAADGSFRDEFIADIQDKVDTCYKNFTEHVATHRGLSVESVRATEAKMYFAEDAIKLGLMDEIMTSEEFFGFLATRAQTNMETKPMSVKDRFFKFSKSDGAQTEMAQLQELQAQLSAAQEQLATMADLKGAVSTLTASLAEKEAAFAGMKAKLAELEGAKAQAAVDSRRAMLAEQLPADQVDMNLNALASLDDASFSVIVGQFKATKDARAASFEEAGGEGVESEAPEKQQSEASLIDKIRAVGVASAKAMK